MADETSEVCALDCTRQVANILWLINGVASQANIIRFMALLPGYVLDHGAKARGEEEVVLQEQKISLDVEETKSDWAMTQRMKC